MSVPQAILDVPRPTNTVVVPYGKNKDRYAVRERIGCKRVNGKPTPETGRTIGHIRNGRYIPKDGIPRISYDEIDRKDWANVRFCTLLSMDLLDDLRRFYSEDEAEQLYCSAVLRACYPGVRDGALRDRYLESFLSEMYPGVALSANSFSDLLDRVGKAALRMKAFMKDRVSRAEPSHHRIIDATLKKNKSIINNLAEYTRKFGGEYPAISVMYAFDLEDMEVTCMDVYAGDIIDARAFKDFISSNGIKKGIVVADKGFPRSSAADEFEGNEDLHFLLPLKGDNSLITRYSMLEFDEKVQGYEGVIGKKLWIGDRWLYSFRDARRASRDELSFIDNEFDGWEYERSLSGFGTIVFECDLDLDLGTVYAAYDRRWMIELVFRMYKISEEFDDTREHSDYSVRASEFVNFLATVMSCRMFKAMLKTDLLDSYTYGDVMKILRSGQKEKREDGTWAVVRMTEKRADVLVDLGVVPEVLRVKNPVGRPRKSEA